MNITRSKTGRFKLDRDLAAAPTCLLDRTTRLLACLVLAGFAAVADARAEGLCPGAELPSTIEVSETPTAIKVSFDRGVRITLGRDPSGSIRGIDEVVVDGRPLVSAPQPPALVPAPALEIFADTPVGGVSSWPAYLLERDARGGVWPRKGGREMSLTELSEAAYLCYRVDGEDGGS